MTRSPSPRPSLASLAAECGVSRQTVSNVINSPEVVAPETRKRVEKAIRASGYRPSAAGRALRTQRSMTLAMRMHPSGDGINGAIVDRFIHEIVEAADRRGYRISLLTAASAAQEAADLTELFERGVADGCILTDTTPNDPRPAALRAAGVPFVAFGRPWGDEKAEHNWVDVDGAAGTREATVALHRAGLGPIGFLGWPSPSGVGDDRRRGWFEAIGDLGGDPTLEARCIDDFAAGVEAARELLARGAGAFVCASDTLAAACVEALRQARQVPCEGELWPVIGFDNTAVSRFRGVSSINQPVEDAAQQCVDAVIDLIQYGATHPARQVLLTPPVVIRHPALPPTTN